MFLSDVKVFCGLNYSSFPIQPGLLYDFVSLCYEIKAHYKAHKSVISSAVLSFDLKEK